MKVENMLKLAEMIVDAEDMLAGVQSQNDIKDINKAMVLEDLKEDPAYAIASFLVFADDQKKATPALTSLINKIESLALA